MGTYLIINLDCRPHHLGHQFHYDSENEGHGELRHPLLSSVLFLKDGCGGPTVITNQSLGENLADKGWLVHPKENRLAVFDASYLHGVVPGKGPTRNVNDRRITFMVGFWDHITIKNDIGTGPSRNSPKNPSWLAQTDIEPSLSDPAKIEHIIPSKISSVWQYVDAKELSSHELPMYDLCFQGF